MTVFGRQQRLPRRTARERRNAARMSLAGQIGSGLTVNDLGQLDLNINGLTVAGIAAGDYVPFWDITATAANKKITFANFEGTLNHDSLTGYVANEHIDWTGASENLSTSGSGTFGQVIDNGLTASLGVYTDASKQLTSTPPTSGVLGYWSRAGTVLSPSNVGDDISLQFGDLVSEQNPDAVNAIRIKGTSDVDVVIGSMSGFFAVWNVADDTPVFYVNERGDTDIAGDFTTTTGTVTGEQITSIDDITMAGLFANVMAADDTIGLDIDGITNPSTAGGTQFIGKLSREWNGEGSSTISTGLDYDLNDNYKLTGNIFRPSKRTTGMKFAYSIGGDHDATASVGDFAQTDHVGMLVDMTSQGQIITAPKMIQNLAGLKLQVTDASKYFDSDGWIIKNIIGSDIIVSTLGVAEETGTSTRNLYGSKIKVTSTSSFGTINIYGLYIDQATGGNNNYGIWDASGADWVLDGDNQETIIGEGQDVSHYFDGEDWIFTSKNVTANDEVHFTNFDAYVFDNDTFFTGDGSGLPYGSMSQENVPTSVTINTAGTFEIVTGMTGGETNLATFQNSQELKVLKAGRYFISWAVSFNMASGSGQEVEGAIGKGGTEQSPGSSHRTIGTGNDTGSMCGQAILDLAADDLITVMVTNESSTVSVVVEHASLSLVQVGGT